MPGYRKQGKREAYEATLEFAATLPDPIVFNDCESAMQKAVRFVTLRGRDDLTDADVRQVAAKAIRVERDNRIGANDMVKKSFDLSRADCELLAGLQARLGLPTEVAVIRKALHNLKT